MQQQRKPADPERLRLARRLADALERGDQAAELEAVHALLGLREKRLHSNLSRIANDLREALSAKQFGSELSRLAESELPDAQHRLNRVIELTESAADTSLSAVETALPAVRSIVGSIEAFDSGGDAQVDALLEAIVGHSARIEKCLSDVLLAQSFQDITGQIIRRIVKLVAELEQYLSDGLPPAPAAAGDANGDMTRGKGPAIAGLDTDAVQHQKEVDELLGNLGV